MTDRDPLAEAAMILLKAHTKAKKKPLAERSPLEVDLAYLGRNRLIRIAKGKHPAINAPEPEKSSD